MHQRFFAELKRRRVFRVVALYGAAAFAVLQVADLVVPLLGWPESVTRIVALSLLVGFPLAVALEWAFEFTPFGLRRESEASPGELKEIILAPASQRWPSGLLALAGLIALLAGAWYVGRQSVPGGSADAGAGSPTSIAVRDKNSKDPMRFCGHCGNLGEADGWLHERWVGRNPG
jgi:hypothetical protein